MNTPDKRVEEIIEEFRNKFQHWNGIKTFCAIELSEREVLILEMREQKKTLEEVSKAFGVTRERIRQIEAKANEKVRMKDYFQDWLRTTLTQYSQELVRKVLEEVTDIELAVDKITIDRIEELETKAEVFGYAQGFICKKLDDKKQAILSQFNPHVG